MVETCLNQLAQPLTRQPNPGSDEVRVKTRLPRSGNHLGQIRARQRFASGKVQMQNAERRRLVENPQPVDRPELLFTGSQLQRIRAVDAMQRAAVRDLGNQGQRIRTLSH